MDGISFIIRVRNEEANLDQCIRSLSKLTIPYDVHVILHMCTDRSLEIAEKIQTEGFPVHIHTYDYPISRAGYEYLVTNKDSPHSMTEYTRWSISKSTRVWTFRWDADFTASDNLIQYLNEKTWETPTVSTQYKIHYVAEDAQDKENYLFSGNYEYSKYMFWEYIQLLGEHQTLEFPKEAYICHNSILTNKKSYWNDPSWFSVDSSEEAIELQRRYNILLHICGPEPNAQARSKCPDCEIVFFKVRDNEKILNSVGISFYS
jgi:glycosyltransferase involved in cell wall biosynthesis